MKYAIRWLTDRSIYNEEQCSQILLVKCSQIINYSVSFKNRRSSKLKHGPFFQFNLVSSLHGINRNLHGIPIEGQGHQKSNPWT